MKVVKVYGALRKRLGQCRFELDVATPAQAIKALCVNFPGLNKWLIDSEQDGVGYRVKVGKEQATPDDMSLLGLPWSEREVFSITPVVTGAGAVGRILGGIALVAAAVVFAPAAAAVSAGTSAAGFLGATGTGFFSAAVSATVGAVGTSLVLGGIAQAISPTPSPSSLERGREAARLESFSFSGITNTTQQGLPVPIAYGRVFVGSAVISAGLDVDHSPSETVPDPVQNAAFLVNRKS
jgi:predicted phage tail protein